MDKPIKKTTFGGYNKAEVDALIAQMQAQLEQFRQSSEQLSRENDTLRNSLSVLESVNHSLKEEVSSRQAETRRLESQIDELHALYQESSSARRDYDQYLNTVGQVYMVACESADGIVKRAENNARKMLDDLSEKAEKTHTNAEQAIQSTKAARDKLAGSLPSLIENIQHAFQEIDEFLAMAQAVPQSCNDSLGTHQSALLEMQQDVDAFHQRSHALVAEAERSGSTSVHLNEIHHVPPIPASGIPPIPVDMPRAPYSTSPRTGETYHAVPSPVAAFAPEASPVTTPIQRNRLTLLEQEKLRRRQEMQSEQASLPSEPPVAASAYSQPAYSQPPAATTTFPAMVVPSPAPTYQPVPIPEPTPVPASTAAAASPLPPASPPLLEQEPPKRRANVKDLLDKYSRLK